MSISKIWSSDIKGYRTDIEPEKHLRLQRMNFLIGPNNSGKSRLLRTLFSSPVKNLSIGLGWQFQEACHQLGEIFDIISRGGAIVGLSCSRFMELYSGSCKSVEEIKSIMNDLSKVLSDAANPNLVYSGGGDLSAYYELQRIVRHGLPIEELNRIISVSSKVADSKRHYIPILRGMRPLGDAADLYFDRTIKDYFYSSPKDALNIVTGFNLYDLLARFLLGEPEERERIKEYERILGNEFFGGRDITLIPQYGKDTVAVKIGTDNQFPIYDLGDGLQQVIIITSAAYLEKSTSIFFIEEPEACLHPGLLRKLALFLIKHTDHQYLATTHSNHLLDLAENSKDVMIHKVYKFEDDGRACFQIQECTRDRDLLAELGVLASSVYLANSTIWVEGITDRLYLKAFLAKYLEGLNDSVFKVKLEGMLENFHYAFVEYQGGTLGHWGFDDGENTDRLNASKLCAAAFLIADGDIINKGVRSEVLSRELQDRYHLLPCKEIENLLPLNIIEEVSKNIFLRKKSKTTVGLEISNLSKISSKAVSVSEHGIGYHLDKCLGLKGRGATARRVFADESGTISEKVKFCREAVEIMRTTDWSLSDGAKDLCAKIFAHIVAFNH
ncbi:ATP-binding protein [Pseudomonas sp. RIT778]|uniref:AAA family ATPase n=1 Tax=Pseudomonas sp. RIT778 TaxID=2870471 RepID=UPI001C8768BF|nr:ATP-binding protein [Pseudomonas sp. RIT778]MBX8468851.1 ATP-binding protein [Pseudomonas sp. RIT778]